MRVYDVNAAALNVHRARFLQLPEGSGNRLPVGSHHARKLLMSEAGEHGAIAFGRQYAVVLAEGEYQGSQPGWLPPYGPYPRAAPRRWRAAHPTGESSSPPPRGCDARCPRVHPTRGFAAQRV